MGVNKSIPAMKSIPRAEKRWPPAYKEWIIPNKTENINNLILVYFSLEKVALKIITIWAVQIQIKCLKKFETVGNYGNV